MATGVDMDGAATRDDDSARTSLTWTRHLAGTGPETVPAVRAWARELVADLPEEDLPDVLLVVSELITNAIEHGGGPNWVRLSRRSDPSSIQVEVEDANLDRLTPGTSRFGVAAHRGRGLLLVGRMSLGWGVQRDQRSGRKTVWATMACPALATPHDDTMPLEDAGTGQVTVRLAVSDLATRQAGSTAPPLITAPGGTVRTPPGNPPP